MVGAIIRGDVLNGAVLNGDIVGQAMNSGTNTSNPAVIQEHVTESAGTGRNFAADHELLVGLLGEP